MYIRRYVTIHRHIHERQMLVQLCFTFNMISYFNVDRFSAKNIKDLFKHLNPLVKHNIPKFVYNNFHLLLIGEKYCSSAYSNCYIASEDAVGDALRNEHKRINAFLQ